MFPNVVMNAKIHHGSIALTAGDLSTQNVDVVAVCSTSEVLLKNILDQAEAGPGNLNCKSISFVPWIITSNSISEFVSTSLNHPKKYRTVAFPALRYGLANCPTDVVAKAMIDAAISKIQKTTIHCTVSFIILPDQLSIHHEFANRLASIQKTSEPFGSIECSFSKLALQLTAKQEVNFKKYRSDIKSHLKTCSHVKCRDNEEKIHRWTQQSVLKF
ncbi:unnamed protein product [Rotaria magnacalcarata]|uniref:Macro domain-containing protein n=1 Tax=Rotaria magnacalcarata TaxID=392030 RepID=A0A8S3BUF3_9BILA|nr:unnamed protein product [Rotaria magnacalcarata]CAF4814801.1 unnamed protein product [Rotaria magnacalcarata]